MSELGNSKGCNMPFLKCFPCLKFQNEEFISKVDLSNFILTDVFPHVWQHERTLEELILTSTRIISLPPQLFYCHCLRKIIVNNNALETIPNAIGALRQLQHLDLSRNLLSNIPDSIKMCKNLTHLDLSSNNLQRLPEAITCLISLQELLLNETFLEFLPANFGRLVNLKILELRLNNLITLPKSMARFTNLQRIDIGGNEFTELPEVIGELKTLRELWIDFNHIRRMSINIANLRELIHFEANGNLIQSLPNEICHWRNVEVLSVCTNNLEALPFSIGMMKSLVTLKCESNYLRQLPDSICHLENLEELVISHNQLAKIPITIGLLKKLRVLFVDNNELRLFPEELCNCSNLSVLSASGNKLTELPQNMGQLSKLKVLNIVNNYVSSLPVSVLSLINLTSLWISDNQSQPLVPLQYLDAEEKTQLTCFMLPQSALDRQKNMGFRKIASDAPTTNSKKTYKINKPAFNYDFISTDSAGCSSSSRRICFAEEAIIMTPTQQQNTFSSVDTSSFPSPRVEEPLGTRLMRSPTPFPKELLYMSKYARSKQKLAQKDAGSSYAMDSNVLPNADNSNATNKSASNESNIVQTLNSTPIGSVEIAAKIAYENLAPMVTYTFNPYEKHQIASIIRPQLEFENCYVDQQVPFQEFYVTNCPEELTVAVFNMRNDNLEKSQPLLLQQAYSNDYEFQQNDHNSNKPPPYHVAKVLTTKSVADLIDYETLRNQKKIDGFIDTNSPTEVLHIQQQDSYRMNSEQKQAPYHGIAEMIVDSSNIQAVLNNKSNFDAREVTSGIPNGFSSNCCITDKNDQNLSSNTNFDHENNIYTANIHSREINSGTKENFIKSTTPKEQINGESLTKDFNLEAIECNTSHEVRLPCNNVSKNAYQFSSLHKKTPWLFGVHKNPTVKQVTLHWEGTIGFEIEQLPYQEGIFISSTTSDTNAEKLLCHHDKLLEIDGYDFTNISINEARRIISQSNATINIMLSRK